MRGKHSTAAATRRDRADLEERAVNAERRAIQAEAALAELRETSERRMNSLHGDIAQLRKEREAGAAPALAQAEERIRALMGERDAALGKAKNIQAKWTRCATNLRSALESAGFSGMEATEILLATISPDGKAPTVAGRDDRVRDPERLRSIQAARGQRHSADPLASIRVTS
ncbi:hypothetical protein [Streptomyces xanthophaeus]|uniref:hypothetical protein n=1 Tax=Streptomyces xanthophaeus TaxID=67385 RepID=UPI002647DEE1|nr:hypothetical protein [Streptomyces xanthophaeus]WKD36531.1 hypothetical protein KO717_34425 [Streptomyces xanthophaeus]